MLRDNIAYDIIRDYIVRLCKWNQKTFDLDLEYGEEGFEIEYPIKAEDLPLEKRKIVSKLSKDADQVELEEVYGMNMHFYEVYVYKGGRRYKYNI